MIDTGQCFASKGFICSIVSAAVFKFSFTLTSGKGRLFSDSKLTPLLSNLASISTSYYLEKFIDNKRK